MNLEFIQIELKKSYDRRNPELADYNLVILEGAECLITKEEYDFIDAEYNREVRNSILELKLNSK
tara:strand:+ start:103 stop:297 length:195 start_codon:yes stop_codon:yes gene_type:complete